MNGMLAIAAAGLFVTMFVGFSSVMRTLGRMEQRLDLLWGWYLQEHGHEVKIGHRRRDDPPAELAHDDGFPAADGSD